MAVSAKQSQVLQMSKPAMIADIGATNARYAILKPSGEISDVMYLPCKDFTGFVAATQQYLKDVRQRPDRGVIAVACPVLSDEIKLTNNHWSFSIQKAQAELGLNTLKVINDFTAQALAMPHVQPTDMKHIGGRSKQPQERLPIAVIGPGSGLGMGGLVADAQGTWVPIVTEGGHATCPATTELEEKIIHITRRKHPHVSCEHMLSGPGLVNIYRALCEIDGVDAENLEPMEVTEKSQRQQSAQCQKATKVFSELLGTVAGNLVLTLGAVGGLYIAGGIVKKMEHAFDEKAFRARFEAKDPMQGYLKPVPTYMIISRHVAFLGLKHLAQQC